VRRYNRARAGELVHFDVKKLARFCHIGHRITGDRRGQNSTVGWEFVHVAVDDASRLAYVEILPDEKREAVTGFLVRALRYFKGLGITVERVMSDNGAGYVSRLRHIRTLPYTPKTNGKAERFIQPCSASGPTPCRTAAPTAAPPTCRAGCATTTTSDPMLVRRPITDRLASGSNLNNLLRSHT
jgi:transposase InsO family protein